MQLDNLSNEQMLSFFCDRPITFYPVYRKIAGSIPAALMLQQLLYWWSRKSGEELYKTIAEIEKETSLTRYEQEGAIKLLKRKGFISMRLRGIPAKRHFMVHIEAIIESLSSLRKNHKLDCGISANSVAEKPQTITESTTENTTENISTPPTPQKIPKSKSKQNPPPAPQGEPSASADVISINKYTKDFLEFWAVYPKKVGKAAAFKVWKRLKLKKILPVILEAVEKQKQIKQWTKDGGEYIPHPTTWLNQGRWEDELDIDLKQSESFDNLVYCKKVLEDKEATRFIDSRCLELPENLIKQLAYLVSIEDSRWNYSSRAVRMYLQKVLDPENAEWDERDRPNHKYADLFDVLFYRMIHCPEFNLENGDTLKNPLFDKSNARYA